MARSLRIIRTRARIRNMLRARMRVRVRVRVRVRLGVRVRLQELCLGVGSGPYRSGLWALQEWGLGATGVGSDPTGVGSGPYRSGV